MCAVVLTYGGGGAMFWFHAVHLGEGGPAISPWLHWGLDSTAGFLGLTPLIALILPAAAWATVGPAGTVRAGRFALVGGTLLAVLTAPAPLFHDRFLARGSWLAGQITEWWGDPRYVAATAPSPPRVPAVRDGAARAGRRPDLRAAHLVG